MQRHYQVCTTFRGYGHGENQLAIVELDEGDEIIFADAAQNREPYRFVGMGEVHSEGGLPLNTNILQLDKAAIERFANTRITVIYIKNNSRNEMRKFAKPNFSKWLGVFWRK